MSIRNVSIIIPCYKAAATLRRAVASALTDAPSDIEILLVDDGSPDDTGALCDELAAADPRITALHRENGGAGAARNTGLDAASGEWVLFLDADDALLPGLWSALDGVITDADMILFGLTRVSTGDIQPTDYLPAGEYADLAALGGALSPLLFDTGCWLRPILSCSAAARWAACGLTIGCKSMRMFYLTYNFYKFPLPFIACMVYTISSMIRSLAVCPAACGGIYWTPSASPARRWPPCCGKAAWTPRPASTPAVCGPA